MRVLITNNTLGMRAGTEMYVRDIALALQKNGHQPMAYSNLLGEVAEELREAGIPVTDDLNSLAEAPEILHGHHHLETMTALRRFPKVPAIYVCHGWRPWQEKPPVHPRIMAYGAVELPTRAFVGETVGLPPDQVRLLLNFVDLDRFQPREPLPAKPRRALIFSNYAHETTHLPPIREACQRIGLPLDVAGVRAGVPLGNPENILGSYDLIFAKGRAALESLAVGTAVIVGDEFGLGPMVQSLGFAALRKLNFGSSVCNLPLAPEPIIKEIEKYDPEDAARVCHLVREQCDLKSYLVSLVGLYEEALSTWTKNPSREPEEQAAEVDYLKEISLFVKGKDGLATSLSRELDQNSRQLEQVLKQRDQAWEDEEHRRNELVLLEKTVAAYQATFTMRLRDRALEVPGVGALLKKIHSFLKRAG
jgi:hypothetical protein